MITVASIVEGDGEVQALPVLLRRLGEWKHPDQFFNILPPIRVRKDQFLNKPEVFRKQLLLAALNAGESGWVLVVLDADDDCPRERGSQILESAKKIIPHRAVSVVLANKEFEAWFIASAETLHGRRGLVIDPNDRPDAETIRGGKEWLSERIPNGKYREVTDQPALAALIDLALVHERSRSFRKLCKEWDSQAETILQEHGQVGN
jgi:hypothetical protein